MTCSLLYFEPVSTFSIMSALSALSELHQQLQSYSQHSFASLSLVVVTQLDHITRPPFHTGHPFFRPELQLRGVRKLGDKDANSFFYFLSAEGAFTLLQRTPHAHAPVDERVDKTTCGHANRQSVSDACSTVIQWLTVVRTILNVALKFVSTKRESYNDCVTKLR